MSVTQYEATVLRVSMCQYEATVLRVSMCQYENTVPIMRINVSV